MKIEIETYITNHYYELLKICKKYTKNDDWASELLHAIILQLYEQKEIKVKLDQESIKSYIIRVIMVNWCFPNSPFNKKIKNVHINDVDINEVLNITKEETNYQEHKILEIIENEWAEMNWFNKIIFEKYLLLGSLKKVAKDTTIPLRSITRYVSDTKTLIKQNTFKRLNND